MDMLPGYFSGNPLGSPGSRGDLPVHGHGIFHDDIGAEGLDIVEEYLVQLVALLFTYVLRNLNPMLPKAG